MFFIIFAGILLILWFIAWLLRVRLNSTLKYSPQDKNIKFELFLEKNKISDYLFNLDRNDKEQLEVQYYKKGLLIHSYTVNELIRSWKEKRTSKNVSFIRDVDMFRYKKKIWIEKITVHTDIGWDDAAGTAMLHGLFIALLNLGLGKLYENFGFPKDAAKIKVNPFYQKKMFNAAVEVVFVTRFVYLVLARLRVAFYNAKQKKREAQNKDRILKENLTRGNAC